MSHIVRIVMVFCAVNMLLAQVMGLHFHRHMLAGAAEHGTSLQLRDAGTHLHEQAGDHHATGDGASHPDEDVEIDPLGAGFAKFAKVWVNTSLLILVALCLILVMPAASVCFEPLPRRSPALYILRPPSTAPPRR